MEEQLLDLSEDELTCSYKGFQSHESFERLQVQFPVIALVNTHLFKPRLSGGWVMGIKRQCLFLADVENVNENFQQKSDDSLADCSPLITGVLK